MKTDTASHESFRIDGHTIKFAKRQHPAMGPWLRFTVLWHHLLYPTSCGFLSLAASSFSQITKYLHLLPPHRSCAQKLRSGNASSQPLTYVYFDALTYTTHQQSFCRATLCIALPMLSCGFRPSVLRITRSRILSKRLNVSQSGSPTILVFTCKILWQNSDGIPSDRASNAGGV